MFLIFSSLLIIYHFVYNLEKLLILQISFWYLLFYQDGLHEQHNERAVQTNFGVSVTPLEVWFIYHSLGTRLKVWNTQLESNSLVSLKLSSRTYLLIIVPCWSVHPLKVTDKRINVPDESCRMDLSKNISVGTLTIQGTFVSIQLEIFLLVLELSKNGKIWVDLWVVRFIYLLSLKKNRLFLPLVQYQSYSFLLNLNTFVWVGDTG